MTENDISEEQPEVEGHSAAPVTAPDDVAGHKRPLATEENDDVEGHKTKW